MINGIYHPWQMEVYGWENQLSYGFNRHVPSGHLLQFAIENGPFIYIYIYIYCIHLYLPIKDGDFL